MSRKVLDKAKGSTQEYVIRNLSFRRSVFLSMPIQYFIDEQVLRNGRHEYRDPDQPSPDEVYYNLT